MPRSERRYTRTAIALHWVVAALVLLQIGWGWWMQGIAKQPVGPRVDAFNLHKSLGLLILALMLARLAWRARHPPPPLEGLARWRVIGAHASHRILYAGLILQPLLGLAGSIASGYPVRLFGVVLPALMGPHALVKDAMSAAHLVVSWMLVATIAVHVAAAIGHGLARDGVLARMLPIADAGRR
jgi:cytochrome b561